MEKEKMIQNCLDIIQTSKYYINEAHLKITYNIRAIQTLFIGSLNFVTTDKKFRKKLKNSGPIKSVIIIRGSVYDKPRGYALIQYESGDSLKLAYKYVLEQRIDCCKVIVDIERGRKIFQWRPSYLGGGLEELKKSRSEEIKKRLRMNQQKQMKKIKKVKIKKIKQNQPNMKDSDLKVLKNIRQEMKVNLKRENLNRNINE
ncbi:unnamed protein product [Paramecium sonneborni]|uniref:RRM domain-containing protein n=1 Tax=Paramecium sonneborni TaxID=65129 RepID=A0A8S1Q7L6_9CILI|nr:unnamed protein product [Paramecium sonneborni]